MVPSHCHCLIIMSIMSLFKQLEPYAGYNPYLLTCTLKTEKLDESISKFYWGMYKGLLPSMEDTLLFVKDVEDIAKYIHFVNKNIEVGSI